MEKESLLKRIPSTDPLINSVANSLAAVPGIEAHRDVLLSSLTRIGIGGRADIYAEAADSRALAAAVQVCAQRGVPYCLIGEGANLIASDNGFQGAVLRLTARNLCADGQCIVADAGANLQELVDFSLEHGLSGLETLAGIPGSVGAAVYGNAGAYGHSLSECVTTVQFLEDTRFQELDNASCRFHYRESIFKAHKNWFIVAVHLQLQSGDPSVLCRTAGEIIRMRNEKFPPTLKCAGSIFKNLLAKEVPADILAGIPAGMIREGKVPAGFFLEQVGGKGMQLGDFRVAEYHANLIYNQGGGTATQLCELIRELKRRVKTRFGIALHEEVQYLGDFS